MRRNEAIEHVEYLRGLLRETHVQIAAFAAQLVLWGGVWMLGYVLSIWAEWVWLALIPAGLLATAVLMRRNGRRHPGPMTPLLRRVLVVNGLIWVVMTVVPSLLLAGRPADVRFDGRIGAYFPLMIGLMYAVDGVLLELRMLAWLGGWLALAGLASLGMPRVPALVWLAVTTGGAMVVSGVFAGRLPKAAERPRHLRPVHEGERSG